MMMANEIAVLVLLWGGLLLLWYSRPRFEVSLPRRLAGVVALAPLGVAIAIVGALLILVVSPLIGILSVMEYCKVQEEKARTLNNKIEGFLGIEPD